MTTTTQQNIANQIYFPTTSEQGFPGIDSDEFADAENWQFAVSAMLGARARGIARRHLLCRVVR